jgi:excisionase family DNA binding protein
MSKADLSASQPQLVDVGDVAALLKTSKRHVIRMADSGSMPWGIKLGRLRRWILDEVATWIADGCKPLHRKGVN